MNKQISDLEKRNQTLEENEQRIQLRLGEIYDTFEDKDKQLLTPMDNNIVILTGDRFKWVGNVAE